MATNITRPLIAILLFWQPLGCDPADADCEDGDEEASATTDTSASPEPPPSSLALPADGCLSEVCVADGDFISTGVQPKCRFSGADGEAIPPCIGATAGVVPPGSSACWYSLEDVDVDASCWELGANVQVEIVTEEFDVDGLPPPGIHYECVASDRVSIDCPLRADD